MGYLRRKSFTHRRGRPKSESDAMDYGTPELRQKRYAKITAEPIDWLLEEGRISKAQHKAARRLAWLYRIRYGSPWIRAQLLEEGGIGPANDSDDAWNAEREAEFQHVTAMLTREGCYNALLDICIYQLDVQGRRAQMMDAIRDGLDMLVKYWRIDMYPSAGAESDGVDPSGRKVRKAEHEDS